jgi:hypothetical protein
MSRLLVAAAIATCALFPACAPAGTTDEPSSSVEQPLGNNPESCDGTDEVLAAHHAAFTAHDEAAFAATFTENARHTGPHSFTNVGTAAIQSAHGALFGHNPGPGFGAFANASSIASTRNVTCLRGGVATVDQIVHLVNYSFLTPGLVPTCTVASPICPYPGALRTVQRFVLVRDNGEWKIQALQITAVLPVVAGAPFPG